MARALPFWPFFLFGILEPVALIWGCIVIFSDPAKYHADQVPGTVYLTHPFSNHSLSVTLQLGNIFLLLAMLAVICCWTPHADVAKYYLLAVGIADLGHIYAAGRGLGPDLAWNLNAWNDATWGNIGVSAFLNINRWATLLGLFGRIGSMNIARKNK